MLWGLEKDSTAHMDSKIMVHSKLTSAHQVLVAFINKLTHSLSACGEPVDGKGGR